MITGALLHCPGIGPKRLTELELLGVRTWLDVLADENRIPVGYRGPLVDECRRCQTALATDNIMYFAECFAPRDKWRILSHYLDQTSFFDIETTGLEHDAAITVIVCWHRGRLHTFVEHDNLDAFLELLDDVTLLASFNGSSFDVPRVLDTFHIPNLPCPHIDLRWICHHRAMSGSLKRISQQLGIARPSDLSAADGALAVRLWNSWRYSQNHDARTHLVRYCAADVLLLVLLARRLAGHHESSDAEIWSHLPAVERSPVAAPPIPLKTAAHQFGAASPRRLRARRTRPA